MIKNKMSHYGAFEGKSQVTNFPFLGYTLKVRMRFYCLKVIVIGHVGYIPGYMPYP